MSTVLEPDLASSDEWTDIARQAIWASWKQSARLTRLRLYRSYADGTAGIPDVSDGASDEIKELARQSVRNVCGVVVETFNRGLSVVGFRSPTDADDEPAWEWWQRNLMDAHQHEVHDATLVYGYGFVSVLPDDEGNAVPATWTPLSVVADWDDEHRDLFPRTAMLMRRAKHPDHGDGMAVLFVDDEWVQPGFIRKVKGNPKLSDVIVDGDPWEHKATYNGKAVCPVVRFVNEHTAEDRPPRGEVEPLLRPQRAINSVNFDRLCVSRFSAFKQKVVVGWSATPAEVAKASSSTVWTFEDHPSEVDVKTLDASPLAPYDAQLREMTEQVALQAGIPLHQLTGSLQNVSTETAALAESAHQRKLQIKRESFGESWELVIRLAVVMEGGDAPDDAAEIVWRETEARSFAAVVDGMVKLASVPSGGVPIEELLDLIPGMTQQRIIAVRDAILRGRAAADASSRIQQLVDAARGARAGQGESTASDDELNAANVLKAKADALGVLRRAGVEAADAARLAGLEDVKFIPGQPITIKSSEEA